MTSRSAAAVTSYLATLDALRRRKRWTLETKILRFAALALGATDAADPYGELERAAGELRRGAGWTGPLRSEVRYVVAAMILRQGLSAAKVHARVRRIRRALKGRRVPRGSLPATMAALLLVLRQGTGTVPDRWLDRTEQIMRRWKEDHRWLTGADDLPAAALHAAGEEPVESVAANVERAYRRLHRAGFWRGNQLQLVSHMLAFDPRGVDQMVLRFQRLVERFREHGMRIRTSRYDEAAILALSSESPSAVARRALAYRDRLRQARPRPPADLAFSLAAGLVLSEDAGRARTGGGASDLAQLRAVQAVIAAQQAAVAAAVTASVAASAAASSG